jgi:uncharacterized repeat protein (TIGR03987 family)
MNSYTLIGTISITSALLAYSIAVITEQIKKKINKTVLIFLTSGIVLDIIATSFMIIGSSNSAFTLHGFVGYSALAAMLIDGYLIWNNYLKFGEKIKPSIHRYTLFAYLWWIIAFITGSLLVALA